MSLITNPVLCRSTPHTVRRTSVRSGKALQIGTWTPLAYKCGGLGCRADLHQIQLLCLLGRFE